MWFTEKKSQNSCLKLVLTFYTPMVLVIFWFGYVLVFS